MSETNSIDIIARRQQLVSRERDPRAWWIDDDPFESRKGPGTHSSARDDGSWRKPKVRVVNINRGEHFTSSWFDEPNIIETIPLHRGSIWHFSKTELRHLMLATGAFTIALALMFDGGIFSLSSSFPLYCVLSLIALAPAFILHEFAHKFVAKFYGCWAEFRADPAGLRFGLILAALLGIVFMAPGAVMVAGNATRNQFGKIAVAGPISNMILWVFGFLAWITLGALPGLNTVIYYWLWGNSILCAFNMLPFGPLDGKKIRNWSEPVFYTCLCVALAMVYATITI